VVQVLGGAALQHCGEHVVLIAISLDV